jgi:hypothetical protein
VVAFPALCRFDDGIAHRKHSQPDRLYVIMNSTTAPIETMKTAMKTCFLPRLVTFGFTTLLFLVARNAGAAIEQTVTPEQNKACADCHAKTSPGHAPGLRPVP